MRIKVPAMALALARTAARRRKPLDSRKPPVFPWFSRQRPTSGRERGRRIAGCQPTLIFLYVPETAGTLAGCASEFWRPEKTEIAGVAQSSLHSLQNGCASCNE